MGACNGRRKLADIPVRERRMKGRPQKNMGIFIQDASLKRSYGFFFQRIPLVGKTIKFSISFLQANFFIVLLTIYLKDLIHTH
jgi:hypothetical protein